MYDLIYSDEVAKQRVKAFFPDAKILDASDSVHPDRFSVELPDVQRDQYLKAMLRAGLGLVSLNIGLMLKDPKQRRIIERLVNEIKTEANHD